MRIWAINGSLRGTHGVTHTILQSIGEGVERKGGIWNVINLSELKIESCRACNHCQKTGTYKCIFDSCDDTEKVFRQMANADLLIYASPVYVFGISSLLKRLLERFYSRAPIEGALLTKSGLFFHATDRALTAKPFVSLVVCDNMENLTVCNTKEYFRIFSRFMDSKHIAHIERRNAAAWTAALEGTDPRTKEQAKRILTAYVQAGEELVSKGYISQRTKKMSEYPFVKIPFLVHLVRRIPMFQPFIEKEIRKRSSVMIGHQ